MKYTTWLLDIFNSLIFAKHCIICKKSVIEYNTQLCLNCWNKTTFITGQPCKSCGKPNIGNFSYHEYCSTDCF
ncbi:MAG: double zinc ribbon domain-containing protein [Candidatus Midichloria sp.]